MFTALFVDVQSNGEDVILAVGNWTKRMHFETAVLLAAWMDDCARDAKAWAGIRSRRLYAVGVMHDASNPNWINAGQPLTPNGVPRVDRSRLKKHDIEVLQEGADVVLLAATTRIALPHKGALQVSQWIRLRAKESQTRAGDVTRHWSEITREHAAQHGPGVTRG